MIFNQMTYLIPDKCCPFRRGEKAKAVAQTSSKPVLIPDTSDDDPSKFLSEKVLLKSMAEKDRVSELKSADDVVRSKPKHANECNFCPMSFRKPSDLTRHIRIHTGMTTTVTRLGYF